MNINAVFEHLDSLFQSKQLEQVEPYLLGQLMVANQEKDTDATLAILNELIGFYRSRKRHEESVRVTEQALAMCGREYILGSLTHATTLLNGATAYRFAGQPQKAMELFLQAEAIYKEKLSPLDSHYAGLYNNMSAAYIDLGDYDKAAEYLLRAAAIMEALPDHLLDAAVTHANLAALYTKTRNYYGAKQHIATACNMLEGHNEYAPKLAEFRSMQELFAQLP